MKPKQISHVDRKGKREGRPANWLCDCYMGASARPNNMQWWWLTECSKCGIKRPTLAWQMPKATRPILHVEEGVAVRRARKLYAALAVALVFVVVLAAFVIGLVL